MDKHGSRDPRKRHQASYNLDRDFQRLYTRYKDEDPPPRAQHAIPNTTVALVAERFRAGTPRERITAHLIVLAYFFLLRVGEYTPSRNRSRRKRTIPLRKCDVTLLRNGVPLNKEAPVAELLTATGCTICLENQKNGKKDETIYHEASGSEALCPVRSMAFLLGSLWGQPAATELGTVFHGGHRARVTDTHVRDMLRLAARADHLEAAGYDLARVGTHSLRAGGAVRLAVAGYSDVLIKKLGRWSSGTFEKYIQPHIAPLTAGAARRMAQPLRYYNVHVR